MDTFDDPPLNHDALVIVRPVYTISVDLLESTFAE